MTPPLLRKVHQVNTYPEVKERGRRTLAVGVQVSVRAEEKHGGKRCVFKLDLNDARGDAERTERGREFQMLGAQKANDRRPAAVVTWGTVRRGLLVERSSLDGA